MSSRPKNVYTFPGRIDFAAQYVESTRTHTHTHLRHAKQAKQKGHFPEKHVIILNIDNEWAKPISVQRNKTQHYNNSDRESINEEVSV